MVGALIQAATAGALGCSMAAHISLLNGGILSATNRENLQIIHDALPIDVNTPWNR